MQLCRGVTNQRSRTEAPQLTRTFPELSFPCGLSSRHSYQAQPPHTVLIVALLWATVSLGSLSGISAAIYAACMVLLFDFWRRVFKKP